MQAYSLGIVCLLLGMAGGYVARPTPAVTAEPAKPAAQAAAAAPHAMPSPEQLRHMAEKAVEPVKAEINQQPDNPELLAKAASLYFRAGQYDEAADYYARAAKLKPNAELYVSLSNAYHYGGKKDKAFAALDDALRIEPKSATALFNLGMLTWREKKDADAAIVYWNRLLKAHPTHPRREQVEQVIAKARESKTATAAKTE